MFITHRVKCFIEYPSYSHQLRKVMTKGRICEVCSIQNKPIQENYTIKKIINFSVNS